MNVRRSEIPRARRRAKGAVTVELALLLPFLALALMALSDVGRIYYAKLALIDASRVGLQFAYTYPARMPKSTIEAVTAEQAKPDLRDGLAQAEVRIDPKCGPPPDLKDPVGGTCPDSPDPVPYVYATVKTAYDLSLLFPGAFGIGEAGGPGTVRLSQTSTMRLQ